MRRDSKKSEERPEGVFPDIHDGKRLDLVFSKQLRAELTKLRKFRRPNGKVVEATYVQLLVKKVMNELLNAPSLDVKLLEMTLNRLEGKVPDGLSVSGGLELRDGISARDILLQKLDRHLRLKEAETSDSES